MPPIKETIELIINPAPHDLGGFTVRRALPVAKRRHVGPFVFVDHLGPVAFEPGRGVDVRAHPHIGLATVTWLFSGAIDHRDSLGTLQTIRPGAVNWMTAGRGVVHTERTPPEERANGHRLEAIQTWVALPRAFEESAPAFVHHPGETLPRIDLPGVRTTLIAGAAFGARSPVSFPAAILLLALEADAAAGFDLPHAAELAVYAVRGRMQVAGEPIAEGQMAVLHPGAGGRFDMEAGSAAMILGGDPPDAPRFMEWNFVSSSRQRIERAKAEWRQSIAGGFQGTPFAQARGETSWIPLPGDPQPFPEDTPPV